MPSGVYKRTKEHGKILKENFRGGMTGKNHSDTTKNKIGLSTMGRIAPIEFHQLYGKENNTKEQLTEYFNK